jgi:hypothetical protein
MLWGYVKNMHEGITVLEKKDITILNDDYSSAALIRFLGIICFILNIYSLIGYLIVESPAILEY